MKKKDNTAQKRLQQRKKEARKGKEEKRHVITKKTRFTMKNKGEPCDFFLTFSPFCTFDRRPFSDSTFFSRSTFD